MILSDLIGAPVRSREPLGWVTDVRLLLDSESADQPTPPLRIHGLIISPHSRYPSLGYERSNVTAPWPIAAVQRWRHRDSFLVRWEDIARIGHKRVELRPGYRRYSAKLPHNAAAPTNDEAQLPDR